MILSDEFSEKLTHLMAATAICCVSVTAAPSTGPAAATGILGLVEALLGGVVLTNFIYRKRVNSFAAVLRRSTREVEQSGDKWIEQEFPEVPEGSDKRKGAIAAVKNVLPLIVPKAEELVEARLSEPRIAAYYLKRAAENQPFDFAEVKSNDSEDMARREMTRRLLTSLITKTYAVVARQPEFAAEILHHTLAELLQSQELIRQDLTDLPEAVTTKLFAHLESRGALQSAELAGLQRRMIIKLAQRLKPKVPLDFDEAFTEIEHAVDIAINFKKHALKSTNEYDFVNRVVDDTKADAQFAKTGTARLTITWFGFILRLSNSENARLYHLMETDNISVSALQKEIDAFGISEPTVVLAAIINAILQLGSGNLKAADSASKGIALTVLWVGLPWCRSL